MKSISGSENAAALVRTSLIEQCERFAEKRLFTFYKNQDEQDFLTGEDLAHKAKAISQILQRKLAPGEKVLLIVPQGLDYICGLLACFDANVIAIPTPVTDPEQQELIAEKAGPILKDSKAAFIITDSYFQGYLKNNELFSAIPMISVQELPLENLNLETRTKTLDDIALLLYTSGSTSLPKGVMLSHRNVRYQAALGAIQWSIHEDSRIVSWMPQFHNFGLFLNILAPLISGASSVIMSPSTFIGNPEDWFSTISCYQATHTGAPNFAFDYCSSTIDPGAKDLSLRSLQGIICGGEPVRKETYEAFQQKFKPLGLGDHVFCPHYGMSEAGSLTTLKPGEPMRFLSLDIPSLELRKVKYTGEGKKSKPVVSCGEIQEPTRVYIVNPDNCQPCPAGEIGEIWVQSPSIAAGYLNRKEETADTFSAILSSTRESGFFRSGDLGFIDDNHLYIVGREKEVIIIHGKNHHPVDIEWTIKKYVPSLTLPVSVFSCDIGEQEKVVVVQEVEKSHTRQELKQFVQSIIAAVSENHGLELYAIQLVAKGSIPRTGSGKIQRKACRSAYLNQTLSVVYTYCQENSGLDLSVEESPVPSAQGIVQKLKTEVFLPLLKTDPRRIAAASGWSELGLDSIQYIRISQKIEEVFKIPFLPVMFFKHRSFEDLAASIASQMPQSQSAFPVSLERQSAEFSQKCRQDDIAIIGVSCHFPGEAVDPESFWEMIRDQKDCITSFSQSRPEIVTEDERYYGETGEFPEWGGFISGVDQFDAAFFNISPLEAESMDPQQRKLLELTWGVIEDAGYNPRQIAGEKVGLFVGVHNNDYADLVIRRPELMETYGAYLDSGLHLGMIANRVSRWFDFHGPSEIVNTACSSSLVAVHHAVQSIHQGESNLAIAAGINLILTSRVQRACHRAGMLSKDGRCKTFDQSADGMVRSEGYGALFLKPFNQALKDGDPIYGIIKKTVINHDGQSNSLRAPNMNAQRELIRSAYQDTGLAPETISYIETHGTGTSLGDPIEIQALQEAFQELDPQLPEALCGLGTVKTNIGHCESASGIAGMIKVLMSMKHQTLPGIIHFGQLNPYIHLQNSPFYIVAESRRWKRRKDAAGREIANRAGISSFGLGGVNAHVVVEEYIPVAGQLPANVASKGETVIIPLSARNKQCLRSYVQKLHTFLNRPLEKEHPERNLAGIDLLKTAYTLQTGRAAMEERIAFVVKEIPELLQKMDQFLQGKETIGNCWQGYSKPKRESDEISEMAGDIRKLIQDWTAQGELGKIAEYWVQGGVLDWNLLYGETKPPRINLPTYPFAPEKYWIPENTGQLREAIPTNARELIHPLLQRNTSDLNGLRFSSVFSGREFFLTDHLVKGQRILPGAAMLEMARAAVVQVAGGLEVSPTAIRLKNIIWTRFISVENEPVRVDIRLLPQDNQEIVYEISCEDEKSATGQLVYGRGRAAFYTKTDVAALDLSSLKARCNQTIFSSLQVYEAFQKAGIVYGPGHQGIEKLYIGEGQILAQLSLPDSLSATRGQYFLHPGMVDSALQAFIGFQMVLGDLKPALPFAIEELEIINPSVSAMWASVRVRQDVKIEDRAWKVDIDLCDEQGMIGVSMKEVSFRVPEDEASSAEKTGTLMLEPVWSKRSNSLAGIITPEYSRHIVILCEMPGVTYQRVSGEMNGVRCIRLQMEGKEITKRFQSYASQVFQEIQAMLREHSDGKILFQVIVPQGGETQLFQGLAGLLKTAGIENSRLVGQLIAIDRPENIVEILRENNCCPDDSQIRYQQELRSVLTWQEIETVPEKVMAPWKDQGIYLITGGAGGLGMLFAAEIAHQARNVSLILTGRSPLSAEKQKRFKELEVLGARVVYRSVDVSDREATWQLIRDIREEFGGLDGIIHGAGIIKDNYIIKKSRAEVEAVLSPKITGLVNLDQASQDLKLDFFILFSSIAGALGNAGQADYATANAFMDAYADYRNQLMGSGRRQGRTLAVNWPLWKDGGMQIEAKTAKIMMEDTGMMALESSAGFKAFYAGFSSGRSRLMVLEGYLERMRKTLALKKILTVSSTVSKTGHSLADSGDVFPKNRIEKSPSVEKPAISPGVDVREMERGKALSGISEAALREKAENYFKELIAKAINLPAQQIEADAPFEEYGIDSVMMLELNVRLGKNFGSLSQTLFFEYQTVKDLTGYFLKAHRDRLLPLLEWRRPLPGAAVGADSKE